MRNFDSALSAAVRWGASLLAATLFVAACTTSGPTRPHQVETRDESGFRIIEKVSPSARVRGDFEKAIGMLEEEQYEGAIALLVQVTEAAPYVTTPHIDLAIAYRRVNELERAKASIERALELNPRHPVALNEAGIIYRRMGKFKKARESYERALDLHPEFHFARKNLAILCDVFLRDLDCAVEHYGRYTQAVPNDQAAAMWLTDLSSRAGK